MRNHTLFLMVLCAAVALLPRASQADEKKLKEFTNSIGMKFVLIPAGEFLMGSPESEEYREDDEQQHRVRITKPFYLGVHEVTQEQYQRVMGENPSEFKGANLPVEQVSWEDAVEFCRKLSEKEGKNYRLPTEAEWEYACRAGSAARYCFGDDESQLGQYAWYDANSDVATHPVEGKLANDWGLHDMHGNVWEWCQDWYGDYPSEDVTDPTGPKEGSDRVFRGGSWLRDAVLCRSAYRGKGRPTLRYDVLGFRVSLVPSGE